jgi:hypothetical protein
VTTDNIVDHVCRGASDKHTARDLDPVDVECVLHKTWTDKV